MLVVDDSQETREALAMVLQWEGYRAFAAGSGREALYLLVTLELRPCAVVVDLGIPNLDGLTLRMAMQARSDLARIPGVALGGDGRLRGQALDVGFAAALPKPCGLEQLFSLVTQLCPETAAGSRAKPG